MGQRFGGFGMGSAELRDMVLRRSVCGRNCARGRLAAGFYPWGGARHSCANAASIDRVVGLAVAAAALAVDASYERDRHAVACACNLAIQPVGFRGRHVLIVTQLCPC